MGINKMTRDGKSWQGYGKREPLCTIGRNIKWYRHNGKKSTEVPWEIKNRILSYDPAISVLRIFPKKVKALAWTWIQLPWPLTHSSQDSAGTYVSTGERRNGEGCVCAREYYSVTEGDAAMHDYMGDTRGLRWVRLSQRKANTVSTHLHVGSKKTQLKIQRIDGGGQNEWDVQTSIYKINNSWA